MESKNQQITEIQFQSSYFVYIITNEEKTLLKVGITVDLQEYLSGFLRGQSVDSAEKNYLLHWEKYTEITHAVKRETELASFSQRKLRKLVSQANPDWQFFNEPDIKM
jgi:putative endonuclease